MTTTPCCGAKITLTPEGPHQFLCRECGAECCTLCVGTHLEDAGPDSWMLCPACNHREEFKRPFSCICEEHQRMYREAGHVWGGAR